MGWLLEDGAAEELLHSSPPMLRRRVEYEQMSLFDARPSPFVLFQ